MNLSIVPPSSSLSAEPIAKVKNMWKRMLDILISLTLLLTVFPFMILFAILIKMDSRGPIIYRQFRVGLNKRMRSRRIVANRRINMANNMVLSRVNGKRFNDERRFISNYGRPFPVYKFRTMVTDAEKDGPRWCQENDPRVTRIGSVLRKTHLDELPQLVNVLRGDMSIVGPRPERPEFVSELVVKIPQYKYRLFVKPGVTGLAQICHRADLVFEDVKRKVRYDLLYMKKASLSTDMKIIMGTIPFVLGISTNSFKKKRRMRRFLYGTRVNRVIQKNKEAAG